MVVTSGPPSDDVDDQGMLVLQSTAGSLDINASRGELTIAGRLLKFRSLTELWVKASSFLNNLSGGFSIFSNARRRFHNSPGGITHSTILRADIVDARNSLRGPEAPDNYPVGGLVSQTTQEEDDKIPPEDSATEDILAWSSETPSVDDTFVDDSPKFEYPAGEYTSTDRPRETLTDQYLRLDKPDEWSDDYSTWNPSILDINGTSPVSPEEEVNYRHDPTPAQAKLTVPSSVNPADIKTEAASYSKKPTIWNYLKTPEA
jgi:hypothetical protein